jgi:anionic cell wall polymer biosynthesis LytR-Cps2A-Psr (LCP) family protein
MDDFSVLVDAVGGLRANPKAPLVDAHLDLDIPAGAQRVDGETALDYVRTRVDSDYARAARQQELIVKLVDRLVAPGADVDMARLLDSLVSFETDLPLDDLPTLIEIARRAESARVTKEVLDPTGGYTLDTGDQGDGRGWVIIPNVEAMRAFAAEHLAE